MTPTYFWSRDYFGDRSYFLIRSYFERQMVKMNLKVEVAWLIRQEKFSNVDNIGTYICLQAEGGER